MESGEKISSTSLDGKVPLQKMSLDGKVPLQKMSLDGKVPLCVIGVGFIGLHLA
mgnify:FL=1